MVERRVGGSENSRRNRTRRRRAGLAALPILAGLMLGNAGHGGDLVATTLAVHNAERARLGVGALRWDDGLAVDAAVWARHLARLGRLEHSPSDDDDPDPEGENLWAGTAGHYPIDAMSGLWASERRYFKRGVFPDSSTTGAMGDVGHYTQMVWRSTTRVGCALARGRNDDFFVCRYGEGGNVIGERPF